MLLFYSHMLVMWIVSTIRHFLVSLYQWMVTPHASQTDFRTSSALGRQQSHSSTRNATEWWKTTWHLQWDYRGSKVAHSSWLLGRPPASPRPHRKLNTTLVTLLWCYVLSESYVSSAFPWGMTGFKSKSSQWQTQGSLLAKRKKGSQVVK